MRVTCLSRLLRLALVLLVVSVANACHERSPFEVYGPAAATFFIGIGQQIDIHMQTVGPGEFGSPPTLGGSTIAFLGVGPGPIDPGGITQVFHFKGVTAGTTIITFQSIDNTPGFPQVNVVDTVTVR
jgi:hypothetical protein